MAAKKKEQSTPVDAITHEDGRANIPTPELESFAPAGSLEPSTLLYDRDPTLDPQLVWRGKDAQDGSPLEVLAPPIYLQEKIEPRVIIENLRRTAARPEDEPELRLFESYDADLSFDEKIGFYQHADRWKNRLILGDSLAVMASLAEKEDLKGKVQTIYMDPPYGIKFGSNWQVSTRKRDVKDGSADDVTRQPEQIKAYRDTWELGIHSYLTYLRDRFTVARDLLTESGSIFVQIGDENVHLVRAVLDEVFGSENFVSQITVRKTSGASGALLSGVSDHVVWSGRSKENVKYRALYGPKVPGAPGGGQYDFVQLPDGRLERFEGGIDAARAAGVSLVAHDNLTSQRPAQGADLREFVIAGKSFTPGRGTFKTDLHGLEALHSAGRLAPVGDTLRYVRHFDDFPVTPLTNIWDDTVTSGFGESKVYVVQTNARISERALLMTTDPGDLVLDPTCGSGTTAVVAEQWGRRWITCDTSRVALALARTRIMSAKFPGYLLADSKEGAIKEAEQTGTAPATGPFRADIRRGFAYRRVPHITLKSIAQNPDIEEGMSRGDIDAAIRRHADLETLYDQPFEDKKRVRVAGPFTVESLSPHRAMPIDGAGGSAEPSPRSEREAERSPGSNNYEQTIIENLRTAGVQNTVRDERLEFETLSAHAGRWVQAMGSYRKADGSAERVAVAIGPEHGTVGARLVREAAKEAMRGAGVGLLLVGGFAFDATSPETAAELNGGEEAWATSAGEQTLGSLAVQLVKMNPDLAMGDELLKKTGAGNLFMVFGEPDVEIRTDADGKIVVELHGLDVYDPTTGVVRPHSTDDIACWFIDTDYDSESFFVRHAYFTGADKPYERLSKALKADIDPEVWESLYRTESRPFDPPSTGRIAIKVINHYGDEVLKVYEVDE